MMKKILILNGSPSGANGNCNIWIQRIKKFKLSGVELEVVHLVESPYGRELRKKISEAEGFIFVTGTYWDSWGSPLQKLLEDWTALEASKAILGKPCAVFVLMHSVGGKEVLSRLQGVLSTMGLLIPPMSGMVYSLVSDLALQNKSSHAEDFWTVDDAQLVLENLITATELNVSWKSWPVDRKNPQRKWIKKGR